MKVDFYHIDAFEVANYEPIWRQLRSMGVDANMVAVQGSSNTAATGWFDFARFESYCQGRGIDYVGNVDPAADIAVTTQNVGVLRDYATRVRLMYGPTPYTTGWSMRQATVEPFDMVLVHGQFFADAFSRWKRRDRLPMIGYPRYDDFFTGKIERTAVRLRWGVDNTLPVLAFMPTWENNTAFDRFFPALMALRDRFQIVLRPHHCTQRMEPHRMALMRASGFLIIDHSFDLLDVYAGADLVVSDIRSGSLFEAAMCGLPTVGMVRHDEDNWIGDNRLGEMTRLCLAPDDLPRAVDESLSPKLAAGRERWTRYHVAHRDGSGARRAAEALIELASPHPVQVTVPRVYRCKVSIVLPTYNHAQFLPQAVESVMKQRLTDFELIIVNDGSTDATASYLASLTDPRIKVINRTNGGLPSALNCGFEQASGEFRTWTSADNVVGPTWLEQLVVALENAPSTVGFACGAFAVINSADQIVSIRRGQNLGLDSVISKNPGIASFLYRTTVAEQVGLYDVDLNGAEDWDMWLRILEVCDAVYVDDLLYYYRIHSDSMTSTIPAKVALASRSVIEKLRQRHGGGFDLDRIYPRLREATAQGMARWQARVRLGTCLVDSPFCALVWSAGVLIDALNERFDLLVQRNLVHLLCRHGAWDFALQSIEEVRQRLPLPELDKLRELVLRHDPKVLLACPISQLDESLLLFATDRSQSGKVILRA